MRCGFVRSFMCGLLLGIAVGALTAWLIGSRRQALPLSVREQTSALLDQARTYGQRAVEGARTYGEYIATSLRNRATNARQVLEQCLKPQTTPEAEQPAASEAESVRSEG